MAGLFIEDDHLRLPGIRHGFCGRSGGVSKGIYSSLNCGIGSGDEAAAVTENRGRIAEELRVAPGRFLSLHQVHSATCVTVTEPWALDARPQADAMVTDRPGIALAILTADCGPVLFAGRTVDGRPVIGAAHAGWGGAVRGVCEATVTAMGALGAAPETVTAVLGPCIGPESYEVGPEFKAPFLTQDAGNDEFFAAAAREGHFMFDLPAYIRRRLALAGVGSIGGHGIDTYFNEEDYFSYRRATHRKEPNYGRQASVIAIA
jgi:YfiH family protein